MKIGNVLSLMRKYAFCPNCKSDKTRDGKGTLVVENDFFYRSCGCGFEIKVDENGQEIE